MDRSIERKVKSPPGRGVRVPIVASARGDGCFLSIRPGLRETTSAASDQPGVPHLDWVCRRHADHRRIALSKLALSQLLFGGGPTRASIGSPGRVYVYCNVEPWRSIFDSDAANFIAPYPGDCEAEVAKALASQPTGAR
jgi:hypothetical protein